MFISDSLEVNMSNVIWQQLLIQKCTGNHFTHEMFSLLPNLLYEGNTPIIFSCIYQQKIESKNSDKKVKIDNRVYDHFSLRQISIY